MYLPDKYCFGRTKSDKSDRNELDDHIGCCFTWGTGNYIVIWRSFGFYGISLYFCIIKQVNVNRNIESGKIGKNELTLI